MAFTLAWVRMLSFSDCRRGWLLISGLLVKEPLSSFSDLDLAWRGWQSLRLSSGITSVGDQRYTSIMRKRLITSTPQDAAAHDEGWLDLDREAVVEVTSEDKDYPVEAALVSGETRGWRAADSGIQTIRLIFDQPPRLTRIALVF